VCDCGTKFVSADGSMYLSYCPVTITTSFTLSYFVRLILFASSMDDASATSSAVGSPGGHLSRNSLTITGKNSFDSVFFWCASRKADMCDLSHSSCSSVAQVVRGISSER
jgi:hypothetical protein